MAEKPRKTNAYSQVKAKVESFRDGDGNPCRSSTRRRKRRGLDSTETENPGAAENKDDRNDTFDTTGLSSALQVSAENIPAQPLTTPVSSSAENRLGARSRIPVPSFSSTRRVNQNVTEPVATPVSSSATPRASQRRYSSSCQGLDPMLVAGMANRGNESLETAGSIQTRPLRQAGRSDWADLSTLQISDESREEISRL